MYVVATLWRLEGRENVLKMSINLMTEQTDKQTCDHMLHHLSGELCRFKRLHNRSVLALPIYIQLIHTFQSMESVCQTTQPFMNKFDADRGILNALFGKYSGTLSHHMAVRRRARSDSFI